MCNSCTCAIHAQKLLMTPANVSKTAWIKPSWRIHWISVESTRLHCFIKDPGEVSGQDLPQKQWMTLSRRRTGVGRFEVSMKTWELMDSASCKFGELNLSSATA